MRASKSVVRVTGIACGLGVEGSGWVASRGLVVTNAHVVAGIRQPRVDTAGGRAFTATVVSFDVTNDLAVLRVPGLAIRSLALAAPERGTAVALVGYPQQRAAHAHARTARRHRPPFSAAMRTGAGR